MNQTSVKMNSFGDYTSAFEEWKQRLPRKEKEAVIKKYNSNWSTIYTIWHQRFKDEVWKPHKEALRKQKYDYRKRCLNPKTPVGKQKVVAVLPDDGYSDLEKQIDRDLQKQVMNDTKKIRQAEISESLKEVMNDV